MTKAKIALAAICLMAGIGGAFAFKARATKGYIIASGTVPNATVTLAGGCETTGTGCLYTSSNGNEFQVFQLSTTYYAVRP
jgi:predicted NBD/HSP70 family sugar kinase